MRRDVKEFGLAAALVRRVQRRSSAIGHAPQAGPLNVEYYSSFILHPSSFSSGFTLTELLVVISIIVLMLGLAVPALRILGGGRSIESAENQIGAILGRARAQAISDRTVAGALFYLDPKDNRIRAVIVEERPSSIAVPSGVAQPTTPPAGTVAFDLATDVLTTGNVTSGNPVADIFLLPPGIGVQLLDDCQVIATQTPQRQDDGYLGFNTRNQYQNGSPSTYQPSQGVFGVKYGGVILFDSTGKLVSDNYVFDTVEPDPATNGKNDFTMLGQILFGAGQYDTPGAGNFATISINTSQYISPTPVAVGNFYPRTSQYGLVVFDREAFLAKGFNDEDAEVQASGQGQIKTRYDSGTNPSEATEEDWLDQNATPLMINRFNGTLIRGE